MSLTVYLFGPEEEVQCVCQDCGHVHTRRHRECLFDANVTHNLNTMASAAGIYKPLWRPDEIGIVKAAQLIEPLEKGLAMLQSDPARFEQYNAKNGWGMYEHFVPWVAAYLAACREHPKATVKVWR